MSRTASIKKPERSWLLSSLFISTVLLAAALAAYWNSFAVPLVFDDMVTIQRNTQVRFGEFGWNLISPRAILYKTFTLNYLVSGQEVWTYHLINFILHFLNGVLIFLIASRLFGLLLLDKARCRAYAALGAAFFLLHPVQTESVTYISSRSELLSTSFYLAGFLIFMSWPKDRGFYCSLAVGITYFFGLGSKETVVTLPATIFAYDYLFLSNAEFRPVFSRWRFYLTYVAGASGAIIYLLTKGLKGTVGGISWWVYSLTETRVLVRYVQLIFFPAGLNLDYDFRLSFSVFEPAVLACIGLLASILFLAWYVRRSAPVVAFSIFWFFITISPTSSVVPIIDVIFEHRLYLPLVGVAFSFPLLMEFLYSRVRQRIPKPGVVVTCCSIILIVLLIATVRRNYVWSDEVRLFADVVAKSPHKERPYNQLAWAFFKRAEYDRAISVLQQGFDKMPNRAADISDTLGTMYLKAGQYDKAVELFELTTHAFKDEDRLALAYNNLGVAYLYKWSDLQLHRNQMSIEDFESRKEQILRPAAEAFEKGLEIERDMWSTLDSYINVMCYRGKGSALEAAALEKLASTKNFDPKQSKGNGKLELFAGLYTVGKVAFNKGDYAKANAYFEQAEQVRDDIRIVYFNHGYVLTMLKQDERAREKYIQAIRIDPMFVEAHHNLGLIYKRRKDYARAVEAFTEVLRLDPKQINTNLNLALIYMDQGQKDLARQRLSTVLSAAPDNQEAASMLQQLGP